MENEELDGTAVINGETVSNAVSGENVVSKESADISNEEPKSQLENYIDNLDRDFTDDTSASLSEQEEDFDDEADDSEDSEEEDDGEISFADLGLDETVLAAIEKKGFKHPSPIQVLAIPRLLNGDSNIIAKARTGTGKTAAFGLPIVQRVHEESDHVRAVILEPTRELAIQTCNELQTFTSGKYPRSCRTFRS